MAATKLSDFSGFLTPEQSAPIFNRARRLSVVQQLAQQAPLGPSGTAIPVVTGKLQAGWVAEGARKPVSNAAMQLKTMQPKKLACIAVVSQEVVRANPGGYVTELRGQFGEAFAKAFDEAALHNVGSVFTTYIDQASKAVGLGSTSAANGGVYGDLNAALRLLVNDTSDGFRRRLSGFALDDLAEPDFNASIDTTGRPLFIDTPLEGQAPAARGGRVMGRAAFMGEGVAAAVPGAASTAYPIGYAGDWSQCAWGQIGGISVSVSTETSVTIDGELISTWENNLVAIRAETEYGFLCNDSKSFVKLTKTTAA